MPKWQLVKSDIEKLEQRLKDESPPAGTLYYKYKPADGEGEDKPSVMTNRRVLETDDKQKVKIRFSDLPISRTTTTGLFKSKFVRMTEV